MRPTNEPPACRWMRDALVLIIMGSALVFARWAAANWPDAVEAFVNRPGAASWARVVALVDSGGLDADDEWIAKVVQFADARVRRDLPSSHALRGISPNAFVERQEEIVLDVSSALAAQTPKRLRMFLVAMACQEFDLELTRSASELAFRICKSLGAELRGTVRECRPEALSIFDEGRTRLDEEWGKVGTE